MKLLSHVFQRATIDRSNTDHIVFCMTEQSIQNAIQSRFLSSQHQSTWPAPAVLAKQLITETATHPKCPQLRWFAVPAVYHADLAKFTGTFPGEFTHFDRPIVACGVRNGAIDVTLINDESAHNFVTREEIATMDLPLMRIDLPMQREMFDAGRNSIVALDW